MKLAFCLFRYFPYGGLQRDFLRIVRLCLARGHNVTVYTMGWEGSSENLTINIIQLPHYYSNHTKAIKFSNIVNNIIKNKPDNQKYDLIIGFNKMPGLDIYYCADSCYLAKVDQQKSGLTKLFYKLTARYKNFKSLESKLFNNKTKILFLSEQEKINYQNYYNINPSLSYLLPPNIDKNRFQPVIDVSVRNNLKIKLAQSLNINPNSHWLLMIGSGFRTKGVDRSIRLIKNLLEKLNKNTYLIIIGHDNPSQFIKLAQKLEITENIKFLGGREDLASFMSTASLLLHPAYRENTGTVILESIIMGLPVIASGICGYAGYINQSGCGQVITEPFSQDSFNNIVANLLNNNDQREQMQQSGLKFRDTADIYSADQKILDVIAGLC